MAAGSLCEAGEGFAVDADGVEFWGVAWGEGAGGDYLSVGEEGDLAAGGWGLEWGLEEVGGDLGQVGCVDVAVGRDAKQHLRGAALDAEQAIVIEPLDVEAGVGGEVFQMRGEGGEVGGAVWEGDGGDGA